VRLALTQHGLITMAQAGSVGCRPATLRSRVARGDLIRVLPSVYRLAAVAPTWHQRVLAVVLWGELGAAASHSSAAALLGFKGFRTDEIHVSGLRNPQRLPAWAKLHRIAAPVRALVVVRSIPVTPPWRTLVDLGCVAPERDVERALDDALRRRLVSLPQLRWALGSQGRQHHRGTSVLRRLVEARGPDHVPPESDLEAILYRLVEASDLPPARRQAALGERRADLLFEAEGLVVEVDGWETHGTREAFEDDRARDRAMLRRGLRVLRFTWNDLANRPAEVIEEIRGTLHQSVV